MTGTDESCIKSNVIVRILPEYNTKMHAKERKWKVSKEGKISDLEIVAFCLQGTIYTKWRRFKPEEKLNTDQRPFSFVLYPKQTYEYVEPVSKHDSTCISQTGRAFDKRQFSRHVILCPEGQQQRFAIIFRGGVERIIDDETLAYYPFKNAPEWILACVWDG